MEAAMREWQRRADFHYGSPERVKFGVDRSEVIILDIEGTITNLDFVRKELYSYAGLHLKDYILKNWHKLEVQQVLPGLERQALEDKESNLPGFVPILPCPLDYTNITEVEKYLISIIANLEWQMATDRKTTGLKKIQGLIWRIGYENGEITGHIYDDVIRPLELWKMDKKDVYIYSSGSIEAQMNLLRYSTCGNLLKYFRGFFDTTIGSKLEPSSYKKICEHVNRRPQEVIFFTDRPLEIRAAKECGLRTILVVRDMDSPYIKEEAEFLGIEDGRMKNFFSLL